VAELAFLTRYGQDAGGRAHAADRVSEALAQWLDTEETSPECICEQR